MWSSGAVRVDREGWKKDESAMCLSRQIIVIIGGTASLDQSSDTKTHTYTLTHTCTHAHTHTHKHTLLGTQKDTRAHSRTEGLAASTCKPSSSDLEPISTTQESCEERCGHKSR